MLPRQQRRRHDDGDLQTVHRGDECGSQRHFRFAEADVAADQPVHRLAGGEIGEHRVDAGGLILRLLVREARDEFVVSPAGGTSTGASRSARSAAILISSLAISRSRFLSRALRDCQATPPSRSS